jgi:uncharacterized membrane protein YraQ (UPF0718 family)
MSQQNLAPQVDTCCDDLATCCPPGSKQRERNMQSNAILAAFIAAFIIGDYAMPHMLAGHKIFTSSKVQAGFIFFIGHSLGLVGLLGAITTIAVFVRSFINEDQVRARMTKMSRIKGHGLAAAVGVATPFCSCSAVPVFTGFVRSGIPVSQAISFLVASPLVNEIAVVLLATWAGWSIAGAYAAAGFLIAILAGLALSKYARPELTAISPAKKLLFTISNEGEVKRPTSAARIQAAVHEALETLRRTWIYILIGVGFGAAIHGWVPVTAIAKLDSYGPVLGVVVATIIGIPLYSGIATVIPIISALAEKGMPMGTLLAFAMAVTGLSLPEAMLLRAVMKTKLLAIYFATVAIGIVIIGVGFNIFVK